MKLVIKMPDSEALANKLSDVESEKIILESEYNKVMKESDYNR